MNPPSLNRPPVRPASPAGLHIPNFTTVPGLPGAVNARALSLDVIPAGDDVPMVDIPARVAELIKRCWTTASVRDPQGRSGLQVGANRGLPKANSWKPEDILGAKIAEEKFQERNAPYRKAVAPIAKRPVAGGLFDDLLPVKEEGIARDWRMMKPLKQIHAFTFRGDSRGPAEILKEDGFFPPVTRSDESYVDSVIFPQFAYYMERRFQIRITKAEFLMAFKTYVEKGRSDVAMVRAFFVWRAMVDREALHIPRMVVNEALKGYISTSRSLAQAHIFASSRNGWVYVTRVRGGYLIPTKAEAAWVGKYEEEAEVAFPGHLPWSDTFAFRQVRAAGGLGAGLGFQGPLYVRDGFRGSHPAAYERVIQAFSATA